MADQIRAYGPTTIDNVLTGYSVRVTVGWKESGNSRQVRLSTVRIAVAGGVDAARQFPGRFHVDRDAIGITLLAMLGALIANGTRLGSRSWSSAERRSAGSDDVMLVQSFFRRTIAQAAPVFATEDPRDMTIDFSGGPDTLTLMAPQPGTQSAGVWVQERFYVGQHGGHRDLFVRLRFDPSLPAAAPDPVTLLEGVSQVRFAYFGAAAPGRYRPGRTTGSTAAGCRI